jgi:hypothetical protein
MARVGNGRPDCNRLDALTCIVIGAGLLPLTPA